MSNRYLAWYLAKYIRNSDSFLLWLSWIRPCILAGIWMSWGTLEFVLDSSHLPGIIAISRLGLKETITNGRLSRGSLVEPVHTQQSQTLAVPQPYAAKFSPAPLKTRVISRYHGIADLRWSNSYCGLISTVSKLVNHYGTRSSNPNWLLVAFFLETMIIQLCQLPF